MEDEAKRKAEEASRLAREARLREMEKMQRVREIGDMDHDCFRAQSASQWGCDGQDTASRMHRLENRMMGKIEELPLRSVCWLGMAWLRPCGFVGHLGSIAADDPGHMSVLLIQWPRVDSVWRVDLVMQIERELELQQTKEMLARLGKKVENVEKMDKSGREVRS